jgi:RimJ/RimL family protein N-acetyltransferase
MQLEAKSKAIRRKIAEIGVWPAIRLALRHFANRVFHREELLYYVDIPNYAMEPPQITKDVKTRHIDSAEALNPDELASLRVYGGDQYLNEVRTRLANRWALVVGYIDGTVAGGGWALTNATPFKSKVVPLLDTDVSLIDAFTFPSHRGRGVYPVILCAIVTHFKRRGFLRAFGYVNPRNVPSIKGLDKAGFQRAIAYEALRLGSREIVVWKRSQTRGPRAF